MTWLLRLYPRGWRERYGEEMAALVESEPRRFRLFLDLIAGAVDARVNPQWSPPAVPAEGREKMGSMLRLCSRSGFTREEQMASAAWMVGGSLGFALIGVAIQLIWRQSILSQTIIYSAYPMALILAGQCSYLKPYSRAARWILMLAALTMMFLFFLAMTWLAEII